MDKLDRGTELNPVVESLVEEGHLGLKVGQGIYDWSSVDSEDVYQKRDDALLSILQLYEASQQ
jgi:3-hydroxyacyl-CoA dehydrogenase